MSYVLDTTVVIDHAFGYEPAVQLLDRLFSEPQDLYTCDVVMCEALSKGSDVALSVKRTFLDALEYVALAPDGARWAGEQRRIRQVAGRKAPSTTDALVAAVAHSLGATVVTRNAKDFEALGVPVLAYGPALD